MRSTNRSAGVWVNDANGSASTTGCTGSEPYRPVVAIVTCHESELIRGRSAGSRFACPALRRPKHRRADRTVGQVGRHSDGLGQHPGAQPPAGAFRAARSVLDSGASAIDLSGKTGLRVLGPHGLVAADGRVPLLPA